MRLKNTFEHIFEKYSRDFSGIGDEIDLETGEIVVDNGHIAQLQDERDTGKAFDDWVDDVDGDEQDYEENTYTRYELEDSEDELLSSPSRDVHRRVSQPGGVFASLSSLTWQASPIAPSSSASASQHRNRPSNNRPARHPPEAPRTPQRMGVANDPAFFQALGQSIAQGIAQYMSAYRENDRPVNPVWDAPPLPRPSVPSRRHEPQSQRRRPMVPESPRHPPSRSVWATGRPGRLPQRRSRPSESISIRAPSTRSNAPRRQMQEHTSQQRSRYPPRGEGTLQVETHEEPGNHDQQHDVQVAIDRDEIHYEEQDDVDLDTGQSDNQVFVGEGDLQRGRREISNRENAQYEEQDKDYVGEINYGQSNTVDRDAIQHEELGISNGDGFQYKRQDSAPSNGRGEMPDQPQVGPLNGRARHHTPSENNGGGLSGGLVAREPIIEDEDPMDLDYGQELEITEAQKENGGDLTDRALSGEDLGRARGTHAPAPNRTIEQTPLTLIDCGPRLMQAESTSATIAQSAKSQSSELSNPLDRHRRHSRWTKEDDELFLELRKSRNLPMPQIARYFPGRNPRSMENHYYKYLSRRDKPQGEISEYVRQALERGPILAHKVRMKPYVPKNPETARPQTANLTDQTELLQTVLQVVTDEDRARSTPEDTSTPATSHALPIQAKTPTHNMTISPVVASGSEQEGVYDTGDPAKPWACRRCGKAWRLKSSAKYHLSDPKRCEPLPEGRISRAGRRNKAAVPTREAPPNTVPPGIDVTTGRPAAFNPNILVRENMERTHLCTLCGKSWASHSNAREHSRRPELCVKENWLINYDPGAHRKRKAMSNLTGCADPGVENLPKRTKKTLSPARNMPREPQMTSIHQQPEITQPVEAFQEPAVIQSTDHVISDHHGLIMTADKPPKALRQVFPKRFTVSDKPTVLEQLEKQVPIDPQLQSMFGLSKVMNAGQRRMSLPEQMPAINDPAPQTPQNSSVQVANGSLVGGNSNSSLQNRASFSSSESVQQASIPQSNGGNRGMKSARQSTKMLETKRENLSSSKEPTQGVASAIETSDRSKPFSPPGSRCGLSSNTTKSTRQRPISNGDNAPAQLPVQEDRNHATPLGPTPKTQYSKRASAQLAKHGMPAHAALLLIALRNLTRGRERALWTCWRTTLVTNWHFSVEVFCSLRVYEFSSASRTKSFTCCFTTLRYLETALPVFNSLLRAAQQMGVKHVLGNASVCYEENVSCVHELILGRLSEENTLFCKTNISHRLGKIVTVLRKHYLSQLCGQASHGPNDL
ncbi:SANT domain DNA binding protein [Macrophomina phaseolina MS6]|uniref:SANT domain DNA binding protein n=1 Tax=Macrophomina phaseolina (strain MS6) TaxID=1126212 RepID=K2RG83_MACPH|nr:SANT domain DNA binding protein [Macrophomina phaseolina MS6]